MGIAVRPHHLFVVLGLAIGIVVGRFVETDPRYLGWCFAIGAGLAGGAFFAAIATGEPLARGPAARGRRGAPTRPAWFDDPDDAVETDPPPPAPPAPRGER